MIIGHAFFHPRILSRKSVTALSYLCSDLLVRKMKPICWYILLLGLTLTNEVFAMPAESVDIPDVLDRMWSLLSLRNELQKGIITLVFIIFSCKFNSVVDTNTGKKLKKTIEGFLGAFIEDSDGHIQQKKNDALYRMYLWIVLNVTLYTIFWLSHKYILKYKYITVTVSNTIHESPYFS